MTEFADAAAKLAGQVGAAWGWRPHEFWAATPAELGAIARAACGGGEGLSGDEVAGLKRLMAEGADHG